ncbi:hypothetical protein SAMN05421681_10254 [Lysobacter enzymogenes]|nr:hypothetical protein SAMN05421681_10254 [Lysobacter enzymogenes]
MKSARPTAWRPNDIAQSLSATARTDIAKAEIARIRIAAVVRADVIRLRLASACLAHRRVRILTNIAHWAYGQSLSGGNELQRRNIRNRFLSTEKRQHPRDLVYRQMRRQPQVRIGAEPFRRKNEAVDEILQNKGRKLVQRGVAVARHVLKQSRLRRNIYVALANLRLTPLTIRAATGDVARSRNRRSRSHKNAASEHNPSVPRKPDPHEASLVGSCSAFQLAAARRRATDPLPTTETCKYSGYFAFAENANQHHTSE